MDRWAAALRRRAGLRVEVAEPAARGWCRSVTDGQGGREGDEAGGEGRVGQVTGSNTVSPHERWPTVAVDLVRLVEGLGRLDDLDAFVVDVEHWLRGR